MILGVHFSDDIGTYSVFVKDVFAAVDFLEFLGEFDAVINQKKYDTWLKGDRLYRGVRRRMGRIVYKRSESERN